MGEYEDALEGAPEQDSTRDAGTERVQLGVRMEKKMAKVLKGVAELQDMSLGELLEEIVLHSFEGRCPFPPETRATIADLKRVYGMDRDLSAGSRGAGQPEKPGRFNRAPCAYAQMGETDAQGIVNFARQLATTNGWRLVGPEHLLLGLLRARNCFACRILARLRIDRDALRGDLMRQMDSGSEIVGEEARLSPEARQTLKLAEEVARELGHDFVGSAHVLLGLLHQQDSVAARTLARHGATPFERVHEHVRSLAERGWREL